MSRLRHSPLGFVRYMQMSGRRLFLFTEGNQGDRYFYGRIAESCCSRAGVDYEIISSSELDGASGGKDVLLKFHGFLSGARKLVSDLKGKKTAAIFFLDKDTDDVLRVMVRCRHVVYTKYYDIENHIFSECRLARAASALAGLDEREVVTLLGDQAVWRRRCAERWKDWIKICLVCKKHRIRGCPNFRISSEVNQALVGPPDAAKIGEYLAKAQSQSGLEKKRFDQSFAALSRTVERLFGKHEHDVLFKGKWYRTFLAADIITLKSQGRGVDLKALHAGITGAAAATLDFAADWARHFSDPLSAVIAQIQ